MAMAKRIRFELRMGALAAAAALSAAPALSAQAASAAEQGAEARLEQVIHEAIRAGGPLFTADERAVIERKCGDPPGSWDGFDANISNGVFHCSNGRRLDDPEVRALLAAAAPRIEQRIAEVMRRPEIRAAIRQVARQAAAVALSETPEPGGR